MELEPPAANDWRRSFGPKLLKGQPLQRRVYVMPSPEWDHEHCAFCWQKISEGEGDVREGFCTDDKKYWVCLECYEDFKGEFDWSLEVAPG